MSLQLYPGIAFSPQAVLADNIGAGDTIIPVSDSSAFPDAPNLATIGTDEGGETVLYTAKTDTALSGCQRGIEGVPKAWQAGEVISRNFTAKDHNDMITQIIAAFNAGVPKGGNSGQALMKKSGEDYDAQWGDILPVIHALTLAAGAWAGESAPYSQTVSVPGVLAEVTAQLIQPAPAAGSLEAWSTAGVLCAAQGAGTLTFTARVMPEEDILLHVAVQAAQEGGTTV